MATLIETIKYSEQAPLNTIRLIRAGKFMRAYNHSAWLFAVCINNYRVMRKYVKTLKQDVFYLGFPEGCLLDNIGNRTFAKTDYGCDIVLGEDEMPDEGGYETWKATVETEQASKDDYCSLPLVGADAEREVIRQLREFPLESKSMVECVVFLSSLRNMLNPTK